MKVTKTLVRGPSPFSSDLTENLKYQISKISVQRPNEMLIWVEIVMVWSWTRNVANYGILDPNSKWSEIGVRKKAKMHYDRALFWDFEKLEGGKSDPKY